MLNVNIFCYCLQIINILLTGAYIYSMDSQNIKKVGQSALIKGRSNEWHKLDYNTLLQNNYFSYFLGQQLSY